MTFNFGLQHLPPILTAGVLKIPTAYKITWFIGKSYIAMADHARKCSYIQLWIHNAIVIMICDCYSQLRSIIDTYNIQNIHSQNTLNHSPNSSTSTTTCYVPTFTNSNIIWFWNICTGDRVHNLRPCCGADNKETSTLK